MAPAHHALNRAHPAPRAAPVLTVAAFALPIAAGLVGTLLPAFGWLPAIGGTQGSLDPWRTLFASPGFALSLQATLATGWAATLLSVLLAFGIAAVLHHRPAWARLGRWLAPVLAMPHAALALGLAFVLLPSGWLVRWVSPGLTGWTVPPDVATVGHASGWPLVLALVMKELPFLLLMLLGAQHQLPANAQVAAARALGYGPVQAWCKVVLPQLYAQLRLPIFAVLAFSLSVVDVALVLGPGNPSTLAVQAVRWFSSPDVGQVFPAAAAATLLLALVLASIGVWMLAERVAAPLVRRWIARGERASALPPLATAALGGGLLLAALALLAMAGLVLWSLATPWRFPDALPPGLTLATWARQAAPLRAPASATLGIGLASTALALALVLACLENESRRPAATAHAVRGPVSASLWLLYLPLLVPQVAFLFGLQVLLVAAGLDGRWPAVVAVHLVFVLPYLFLSLADPWRAFDPRYARAAASLGASPWRVFWRVKLPILLPPLLTACAVGFAVSVAQYLPTLFAGAGRIATLTTEAVTLSSGADRRVIGVWAVLQTVLPMLAFLLAALAPRLLHPHRRSAP
ncbi:ABC transporter permease [Pseudorhodoferax sp. Leaf267]|uniref:ABC transporter permease n=1 Tax=Pseudorhodoferax sp. Leaf267 TaxID=1736316 RepID=UPI0006FC2A43|nr:ABC transporter permease subunit [Pseudorhodoferax sp. Leaf267]KQP23097.1 ABC transporter permease [Pseudorhodoferax sp. Leaf267]